MRKKAFLIAGGGAAAILLLAAGSVLIALPTERSSPGAPTTERANGTEASLAMKGAPLPAPVPAEAGVASGKAAPQIVAGAPALSAQTGKDGTSDWSNFQFDQKIIKNATLSIVAPDVAKAMDQVSDVIAAYPGAFIASSSVRQRDDKTEATVVIKVPSAHFDAAMRQLRQIGEKITAENISTQDVTEQYVDLESQLRNLKATQERYLQLLAKAQTIQDILSIQERLNNVQAQIERTEGRLRFLEQRTSLSTVTINLLPPDGAIPGKPGLPWDPSRTLKIALGNLKAAMQGVLDGAIYLSVYSLPALPLVIFAYWLLRRRGTGALVPQSEK